MRAPGAATGVYALECAMDELAVALEARSAGAAAALLFRPRPERGQAVHQQGSCANATAQGAEAFGWSKRNPEPRSMRDGSELVGWGMATGVWEALQMPIAARIVLTADGHAEVACATSDIGTGTYTIMAQIAADMLGLPLDNITVKLGDSTLPQSPVEGGSWIAASVSQRDRRPPPTRSATSCCGSRKAMPDSPLAGAAARRRRAGRRQARQQAAIRAARSRSPTRCATAASSASSRRRPPSFDGGQVHARNTHSAVFAEVKVDEELGVIRVTRVVSAVAAGRILNPKTARSQIMGGVVWGIGMALHEETLIDHRFGRIMNANLAEYHVPVNADIHDIEVIFVDEPDDDRQPARRQGPRRDRHRRRRGGDRQRGLPRHRQARARPADHARQAAASEGILL